MLHPVKTTQNRLEQGGDCGGDPGKADAEEVDYVRLSCLLCRYCLDSGMAVDGFLTPVLARKRRLFVCFAQEIQKFLKKPNFETIRA